MSHEASAYHAVCAALVDFAQATNLAAIIDDVLLANSSAGHPELHRYAADTERAITRSIGSAQGAVTVSIEPNRLGHPALPKAIGPEEATIMLVA